MAHFNSVWVEKLPKIAFLPVWPKPNQVSNQTHQNCKKSVLVNPWPPCHMPCKRPSPPDTARYHQKQSLTGEHAPVASQGDNTIHDSSLQRLHKTSWAKRNNLPGNPFPGWFRSLKPAKKTWSRPDPATDVHRINSGTNGSYRHHLCKQTGGLATRFKTRVICTIPASSLRGGATDVAIQ